MGWKFATLPSVISRNSIKHHLPVALFLAALLIASACGGTSNDEDLGPTATIATAPPTTRTATPANGVTGDAAPPTSPPTIVFDDSAAAAFWDPLPEGMDPAEFQPDYLTREELTKYQPLPDPDPAAWDIPAEGITPEYAKRVFVYIANLRSAILHYAAQPGIDLERAKSSTLAPYVGTGADLLSEQIEQVAANTDPELRNWTIDDVVVHELETRYIESMDFDCMTAHVSYLTTSAAGSETVDRWVGMVRDVPPNPLNPSGWRQDFAATSEDGDTARVACTTLDASK